MNLSDLLPSGLLSTISWTVTCSQSWRGCSILPTDLLACSSQHKEESHLWPSRQDKRKESAGELSQMTQSSTARKVAREKAQTSERIPNSPLEWTCQADPSPHSHIEAWTAQPKEAPSEAGGVNGNTGALQAPPTRAQPSWRRRWLAASVVLANCSWCIR